VARVYSNRLFVDAGLGAGGTVLGTCPAGFDWVIRQLTATYEAPSSSPLSGFDVFMDTGYTLWTVGPLAVSPQFAYTWAGRHVAPSGSSLTFESTDAANWRIIGSGYLLQLP